MTGPQDSSSTRPISVSELLARNGSIGAPPPVTGRRRRRRGNSDAVTVAELTGEIPVVRADAEPSETPHRRPGTHARRANRTATNDLTVAATDDAVREASHWSGPEPRWPESPPQRPAASGPERSAFPLPLRRSARVDTDRSDRLETQPGAEGMSPDPLESYTAMPVDVMDTEVREAVPATEDSAYVRSYLGPSAGLFFGGNTAAEVVDASADENVAPGHVGDDAADAAADQPDLAADVDSHPRPGRAETILRGGLVVVQSSLAAGFGAALFIAFDQLWRWNNIVALVLSVLVILGLVVAVRVVRRTEDIVSTLIAVAVGAFVTLGPLAMLQSG
ncbi:hypothetical protein [Mycobacterium sp.]|uniref:hypothetical protein n=1 Tax=Mycobacterium sp. TaxID=1785 RepID=UPI001278890A|nr:hypothetical protein [Mycobacterium sp.]KAA8970186.1 MAG: hypothetical protein F6Q13_01015 [Mycobacterium sp.]